MNFSSSLIYFFTEMNFVFYLKKNFGFYNKKLEKVLLAKKKHIYY